MKKKVLQFIHGLSMGGAETLVKEYCLKLNKEKYDVSVLCFYKYHTPYEKQLEEAGIKITYIEDFQKLSESGENAILQRIRLFIQRIFFVRKYIKLEKPDIIHTHLNDNTYIWTAAPQRGTQIFHTVHSEVKALWDGSIESNLDFYATKRLIKKYQMKFIVLHEQMCKETDQFFNTTGSLILNNGIDFEKFDAALSKEEVRKREGIPQDAFVIGHVGRFTENKNQSFLVDILCDIYKRNSKAYLLLVGNGELLENVKDKIQKLGMESRSKILSYRTDIPDLLSAMDCFVLPSEYEGLGIVLIEAQKMQLPCVVSDTVPNAATISNLVKRVSLNKSVEIWAKEIEEPFKKSVKYSGLEEWDMKYIVKQLEAIYESDLRG